MNALMYTEYSKMSQDSIQVYSLESISGLGIVGSITAFGDQMLLPSNNMYQVYGVTLVSEFYANIPSSSLVELRNGWLPFMQVTNLAGSMTNVINTDGVIIPSRLQYVTITTSGALLLAIRVTKDVTTKVYVYSYLNRYLQLDPHTTVTRSSIRYTDDSQLTELTHTCLDTLLVNGYLRPVAPTYMVNDEVEVIRDGHIREWKQKKLKDCTNTTLDGVIHSIVKLHNYNYIYNYNDAEIYLCSSPARCNVDFNTRLEGVGVLLPNLNNDYRTLTHQFVAISNRMLKKAHNLLRKHKDYTNGEVYLRWCVKDHPDLPIINVHHMRELGAISEAKAYEAITHKTRSFKGWTAQTLYNSPLAQWMDNKVVDIHDLVLSLGHVGISAIEGAAIRHGLSNIHERWTNYIIVKYNPYVTQYSPNTISVYDDPWYEVMVGTTDTEQGYIPYVNQVLGPDDRVYAHMSSKMVDITLDTSKITIVNDRAVKVGVFNAVLYYRNLRSVMVYSVTVDTNEYIMEQTTLSHDDTLMGHVTLTIGGYSLINGLDYVVIDSDIHVYSPVYDPDISEQSLVVVCKPTPMGTTAMSHIGVYDGTWDLPRLDTVTDELTVTYNGKRDVLNSTIPTDTIYGVEYMVLPTGEYTQLDLLALQHAADSALDDYLPDRPRMYVHKLVSPFMRRILNVTIQTSDAILRLVHNTGEINEFCAPYMHALAIEPKNTLDPDVFKYVMLIIHPSPNISLSIAKVEFLKRISCYFRLEVNMDNITTI